MDGTDRTGRERKERLRAKRSEAGLAQVSGWVPKERRAFAREVLAALARGANSLPPDPEQEAELAAARSEVAQARAVEVQVRGELDEARTAAARHAAALMAEREAAQVRAGVMERERDEARDAQTKAEAATERARAEAEQFQKAPGLRGRAIRWLARQASSSPSRADY